MSPENARANAASAMARAEQALRASEVLLREGLHADAISDAYYAAFHASRALLLSVGEEPRTHRGVLHRLNVLFVQTGKLDSRHLAALARAQNDRASADYETEATFTREEVEEEIAAARALVAAARGMLDA